MLLESKMNKNMWTEAVATAAYDLNRYPSDTIDSTSAENGLTEDQIHEI